ncbi:MAG: M20/M25/M40 family metallo-hydrolase, partial [Acidothermus cellulolyticus]|nr:M20/M25/M40 family metallo-hydrolase [Acidothermus cellulolyticus]
AGAVPNLSSGGTVGQGAGTAAGGSLLGLVDPKPLMSTPPDASAPAVHPAVRAALERVRADNEWTLQQQASICEIPAPPFREERRAAEMKRRFEELGLQNVRVDSVGNVIAERPGSGSGPVIIFSAHLDTVFPEATDVRVRREGTILRGPGIGDNCRGLAVLLAVARAMRAADVRTEGTIFFVANVGEEGVGNLRGVRYLFSRPQRLSTTS